MPAKKVILPELFFDNRTGQYWRRLDSGTFLQLDSRNCKLHMMRAGFFTAKEDNVGLKDGDRVLVNTQLERFVDYAGPLAGHKSGMFIAPGGKRILVTSEARPVAPNEKKSFGSIETFIHELLGPEQMTVFFLWLKIAWETLRSGKYRPGQLLALAGPPGCGKSFLQVLITRCLGGRSAKPYRYMTGQTHFNSDLAAAEHLMIEDENARSNIAARREFGTAIKDWTVNQEISVHAKGREAVTLSFFRRLSLSVNDEPENLMILPPMDTSIMDKVILFKCNNAELSEDRDKNIAMLDDELPGFVNFLKQLRIPSKMRDSRFGIRAYHNQELLEVLCELSPEYRLDCLINEVIFTKTDEFKGTADELEQKLRASSFSWSVEKLLGNFHSACGTFLARLALRKPERFSKVKNRGRSIWTITKEEHASEE